MKKVLLSLLVVGFVSYSSLFAQRIAVVDIQEVLDGLPEYTEAQAKLDAQAETWQKDIEKEFAAIEDMYQKYTTEEILLSPEMKQKKQDEIIASEQKARELQNSRFGPEGDLFQMRQTLMEPIQSKVYQAIEGFSDSNQIDIVIDLNSSMGVLFSNPEYDITEQILRKLKINR